MVLLKQVLQLVIVIPNQPLLKVDIVPQKATSTDQLAL